jgi:hypothetical protein
MQASESHQVSSAGRSDGSAREPLRVVCFSTYVADRALQTVRHRAARSFLLALRGERVEGLSRVPVGGEERELTAATANDSIDWFGEMAARYLAASHVGPRLLLVPVPTSSSTLDSSSGPWTSLLAISIASNGMEEADVVDRLRWKRPVAPPSRRTASAAELYENLAVTQRLDPDVPVVLVDYLFTAPATLQACASRLGEQGVRVPLAVCAGRTAARSEHDAFTAVAATLAEFEPGH